MTATAALIAGCGGGVTEPAPQAATTTASAAPIVAIGRMLVPPTTASVLSSFVGGPCVPKAGYEDVDEGAQIVVSDEDGRTVGLAHLAGGQLLAPPGFEANPGSAPARDFRCVFGFAVTIEPGSDFYSIAVGGPQRGDVDFTAEELEAPLELSVGD